MQLRSWASVWLSRRILGAAGGFFQDLQERWIQDHVSLHSMYILFLIKW
jgi:hypothetical protein